MFDDLFFFVMTAKLEYLIKLHLKSISLSMKYFYLLILISFCSCNLNQERVCNDFKNGSFKSVINIDGIEYTSVFKRNDSIQVETFNNEIDSSYVRWINDCEVVFTTINPKNLLQKKPVLVKILRTFKNSYDFEYSYVGETTKQKGNATIFEPKSEAKSDAERFCEISKKLMAIKSRKTTIRDIENLDKWDIEVANFEKKYKNNEEFKKRYKACMNEK